FANRISRLLFAKLILFAGLTLWAGAAGADERLIDVWPAKAPGETTAATGETLPRRPNENPPATRVTKITRPQLEVWQPPADKRNGAAVVILPGGGYNYVVVDKEGSEAAQWLNDQGITAFVLRYRTKDASDAPLWQRPWQDGQRAIRLLRSEAKQWQLDPQRIGVMGFSAGGQAAAVIATRFDEPAYKRLDDIDSISCRPDFALLIYPWNLYDAKTEQLVDYVRVSPDTPPTFLVHTHDDRSTSLGSALFYSALVQHGVPAELHVYQNGGHGYGLRPVPASNVASWPRLAEGWFAQRELLKSKP
ncbi:MAG: alpha/beta hydrolase, partial [Planctomycetales bacterium]|nr:alpha/beta hydrolase [Planctomycetales bacterium]